jgi:hypothetical protein
MSAVTTPHHTASAETQEALGRILSNVQAVSELPIAKGFIGPAEKAIKSLHEYAFATGPEEDHTRKDSITESFQELGHQLADTLREYKDTFTVGYEKLIERCATCTDRIMTVFKINTGKTKKPEIDILSDEFVTDLIRFSEKRSADLQSGEADSVPAINFRLKRWVNEEGAIEVKRPLQLFQYIQMAFQRNKIFNRPFDSKIKSLLYLAYCVREHVESRGEHLISRDELDKNFGAKLANLHQLAKEWNADATSTKRPSSISDYSDFSFSDEDLELRQKVLDEFNDGKGSTRQITPLKDPKSLLLFLKLTRKMQAIKPFYRKHEKSLRNDSFRVHDVVMQWYIQLAEAKPEISLIKFAKQKLGSDYTSRVSRLKSDWKQKTLSST